MNKQVGIFNIDVWEGGSPIWIVLTFRNGDRIQFDSRDLPDLEYAVQFAKRRVEEQTALRRGESRE